MPTARGRVRPPRPADPPARVVPPTLPLTVEGTTVNLSSLRGDIRSHQQDLAERAELLSRSLARLVLKLQAWDGNWRTYPHFNSIGEVQAEGTRIDILCGQLWTELRLLAYLETGDPTAIHNLRGQYRQQLAEQATDPSSTG